MKSIIIMALLLTVVVGCHKHGQDATSAEIIFVEPQMNDTIPSNQELHIEGTVTADGEMHGYTIQVLNRLTNEVLLTRSSSKHDKSYAFHEHWQPGVFDTIQAQVQVEVILNHDGLKKTESIDVVFIP
jgi:hypothetical protein